MNETTDFSRYSAIETMRDGRTVEIRSIRPEDREGLLNVVEKASGESVYRRFFSRRRGFSEKELDFFLEVDFVNHVALVAAVEENGRPKLAGAGRFITDGPGTAELAFGLGDVYQGQGIGSALLRHLIAIARELGLYALHADVLPENKSMLKVFERSGAPVTTSRDPWTVHVTLQLLPPEAAGNGGGGEKHLDL